MLVDHINSLCWYNYGHCVLAALSKFKFQNQWKVEINHPCCAACPVLQYRSASAEYAKPALSGMNQPLLQEAQRNELST